MLTLLVLSLLSIIAIQELTRYVGSNRRIVSDGSRRIFHGQRLDEDAQAGSTFMHVEWSNFAYILEANNAEDLCNALQILSRLQELNCQGDRVLSHPLEWSPFGSSEENRMLLQAKEAYGAVLWPRHTPRGDETYPVWTSGIQKIRALNQTRYDRVLGIDPSSLVLQCLDDLFLLPTATLALPSPIWNPPLETEPAFQLMLVEKSSSRLDRMIEDIVKQASHPNDLQGKAKLYLPHGMLLSHPKYGLTTDEIRLSADKAPLRSSTSPSTGDEGISSLFKQAKFIHFSPGPNLDPRQPLDDTTLRQHGPDCPIDSTCMGRDLWFAVYAEYKRRCVEICGIKDWGGSVQAATVSIDQVRSRLRDPE